MIKKISYTLIAISLLFGVIYAASPFIAVTIIKQQLFKLGINSNIDLQHPSFEHFEVNRIELSSNNDQLIFNTEINKLRISYNLYNLILFQKLETLQIEQISIRLEKLAKPNSAKPDSELNLKAMMPSQLFALLKSQEIAIDKFDFHWQKNPQNQLSISGKASLSSNSLSLNFNYSENKKEIAKAELTLDKNNAFGLNARSANQDFNYQLDGTISTKQAEQRLIINLTQTANFKHFITQSFWFDSFLNAQQKNLLAKSETSIKLNHSLNASSHFKTLDQWVNTLTLNNSFDIGIKSHAPHLRSNKLAVSADQANLYATGQIDFNEQHLKLIINNESKLSLNSITATPNILNNKAEHNQLTAKQVALKLNTNLILNLKSPTRSHWSKIKIDDFSASLMSNDLKNPYASLQHQPVRFALSDIDLNTLAFNLAFDSPEITFSKNESQVTSTFTPLPFNRLSSKISGDIKLSNDRLTIITNANTPLTIIGLDTEQISSDKASFTIKPDTSLSIDLSNSTSSKLPSLTFSDIAITLHPASWKNSVAHVTHPEIGFLISITNLAKKQASIKFTIENLLLRPTTALIPFKQADFSASGKIILNTQQLKAQLDKGVLVAIKQLKLPNVNTRAIQIKTSTDIKAQVNIMDDSTTLDLPTLKLTPHQLIIKSTPIYIDDQTVKFSYLRTKIKQVGLKPFSLSFDTFLNRLQVPSLHMQAKHLKDINISGYHRIDDSYYRGDFAILSKQLNLKAKAVVKGRNHFNDIQGNWKLSPFDLSVQGPQLRTLATGYWPESLIINSGIYNQSGTLSIKKDQLNAHIDHKLSGFSVTKDNLSIKNLNITSQSRFLNKQLSQSGSIQIENANPAIPVSNISAQFKLSNLLKNHRSVRISHFKAQLLDADIHLKQLETPIDSPQGKATLHFSRLPLNNILALENQPSLTGSGTLHGQLPFRFKGEKVWITNGKVQNSTKGYIRYQANQNIRDFAKTNTGLDVALNVLEDFHYNTLAINAIYTPDGKLILNNKLSGQNPQWQSGQPIEFSINVEENVLQLFKALNFSQNLTENIQDKIQQEAQSKP
jgi:hypothetical protein